MRESCERRESFLAYEYMIPKLLPFIFMTIPNIFGDVQPLSQETLRPPPPPEIRWEVEQDAVRDAQYIPETRYGFRNYSHIRQRTLSRREIQRRARQDQRQRISNERYTRPTQRSTLWPPESPQ